MLTLLFLFLLITVVLKMIGLAIRLAWGITKVFFTVICFPLVMVFLFLGGLVELAIPILLIVGVLSLLRSPSIVD